MRHQMRVLIYADGACTGNPGKGGYCAILQCNSAEKIVSGYSADTTNNRMELTAVIEGLKSLKQSCEVTVVSDSKYVCDAINKGWLENWKNNCWRKNNKKPVLNIDLWQTLDELLAKHNVKFEWIHGHAGHPENERCDEIAVNEYRKHQNEVKV